MIAENKQITDKELKINTIRMLDELNESQLQTVQLLIQDIISSTTDYLQSTNEFVSDVMKKREKMFGCMKGKIKVADDFNETPDCFKDYV